MDGGDDVLAPYLDLDAEGIARLVLCLLAEEMLRRRLAAYRGGRADIRVDAAGLFDPAAGQLAVASPISLPLSHSSASKNSASEGFV